MGVSGLSYTMIVLYIGGLTIIAIIALVVFARR
jgi:hypothetical protein